ncbi:MAG: hypothetical protein SCK70_10015, partial [bacterium]|nr:hypothetical protein [bacterium]
MNISTRLNYWKSGKTQPLIQNREVVDRLYQKNRIAALLAITLGSGFAYTCRLGLSIVKKPLIDGD